MRTIMMPDSYLPGDQESIAERLNTFVNGNASADLADRINLAFTYGLAYAQEEIAEILSENVPTCSNDWSTVVLRDPRRDDDGDDDDHARIVYVTTADLFDPTVGFYFAPGESTIPAGLIIGDTGTARTDWENVNALDAETLLDADPFLRGYLECALWSTNAYKDADYGDDDFETGEPMEDRCSPEDLPSWYLALSRDTCNAFRRENATDLSNAGSDAQNGHDFWLTREGHGTGFWDRGYPQDVADRLTATSGAYGEECDIHSAYAEAMQDNPNDD